MSTLITQTMSEHLLKTAPIAPVTNPLVDWLLGGLIILIIGGLLLTVLRTSPPQHKRQLRILGLISVCAFGLHGQICYTHSVAQQRYQATSLINNLNQRFMTSHELATQLTQSAYLPKNVQLDVRDLTYCPNRQPAKVLQARVAPAVRNQLPKLIDGHYPLTYQTRDHRTLSLDAQHQIVTTNSPFGQTMAKTLALTRMKARQYGRTPVTVAIAYTPATKQARATVVSTIAEPKSEQITTYVTEIPTTSNGKLITHTTTD